MMFHTMGKETVYDEKTTYKISQEFQRLKGHNYLDHAGATLYSEVQIRKISDDLCNNVFGNPHSLSLHSKNCTDIVEEIRNKILRHFHTNSSKYSLIFTSGATSAIRLLVESFDWNNEYEEEDEYFDSQTYFELTEDHPSAYIYTQSNHTSIIGAREVAAERGVEFMCLGYNESFQILQKNVKKNPKNNGGNSLFAYPAQCNFSGRKYPLDWIEKVQNGAIDSLGMPMGKSRNSKWFVLLDAATYCSTNDLNLSIISPDFVCLSFYKIFGYPTGLGALIVKNSSAHVLKKSFYGGGTVDISLPGQNFRKFRKSLHERFEDGTISFLSIIALNQGLNTFERLNLNMQLISRHVFNLARYAYRKMKVLKHWNGEKLVEFYADSDYTDIMEQGGIININLLRPDGRYIGFNEVLQIANLHNIQFRTGCFCNTGACQRHLRLTDYDLMAHFEAGHVCGDAKDIVNGRPTGSIRLSFGYMTTFDNVDVFIQMIIDSYLETMPYPSPYFGYIKGKRITLRKMWAYPIKSCGAMEVESWRLNDKGLEYDREWMIIKETGVCLTQKHEPKLSLLLPKINLENRTMTLRFRNSNDSITIPVDVDDSMTAIYDVCESKVCGDRIVGYDCGELVSKWLGRHLQITGLRLIKQSKDDGRRSKLVKNSNTNSEEGKLSLSNQAQYLLINDSSVQWLNRQIEPGEDINMDTFALRFRSNFLIDGATEFSETQWSYLTIGSINFKVDGPCKRCQMICIDQYTGEKSRKPLVALSRALNGKTQFGIYLSHLKSDNGCFIHLGDEVVVNNDVMK